MRPQHWPDLLADFVGQAATLSFEWGVNDCALWVCGWIARMTGADPAETFRGTYHTEEGAMRALGERGYANLAAIADATLASRPVALARRGDIVMHADGALGVCNGRLSHFLSPRGVIASPTLDCARAWSID